MIKCEICKHWEDRYKCPEATQFYLHQNQPYAICGGHLLLKHSGILTKEQYLKYVTFK